MCGPCAFQLVLLDTFGQISVSLTFDWTNLINLSIYLMDRVVASKPEEEHRVCLQLLFFPMQPCYMRHVIAVLYAWVVVCVKA